MDAVAAMAPGRFRRRLSDDHSDAGDPQAGSAAPAEPSSGMGTAPRSWLGDGTGSTRGRLPWLSPRERRHPLRDVRLSCFRSYLPGSIGASADGDVTCGESAAASPRTPRTPRLHMPGTPRADKEDRAGSRGLSLSVRRSPGRARGSKSSENVYFVSPPRPQPGHDAAADQQQQPLQQQAPQQPTPKASGGHNLSARLRALSARCMALVHSNKASITSAKRPSSSRPCKQRSFSSGALPGLHDFQRRQLNPLYRDEPEVHDDQRSHDDEVTPLSPSPSNGALDGEEDCDSGILVSDAASTPLSSLPGSGVGGGAGGPGGRGSLPWGGGQGALSAATAAARALRSASLDRELLGGSPLLDHDEDPDDLVTVSSHARRSRASTKSSSSSSEISEIFSRFQRRRVASTVSPASPRVTSSSSRPPSPPLLPAPPQRGGASPGAGRGTPGAPSGRRREFHLVRLTRAAPTEELGIFIAKSDAPDRGAQGYVVAHVVPGGLAHRDGQLRLGDELVVVNGRQLRGLSMAAARQRLRAGPTQVDIVIAREPGPCRCGTADGAEGRDSGLDTSGSGDSMTDSGPCCSCKAVDQTPSPSRRTLPESSVDYENVVLRPRDRTPASATSLAETTSSSSSSPKSDQHQQPSSTPSSATFGGSGALAPGPGASGSPGPSPSQSLSTSPVPGRQQLFQKHAKSARRSLALASRSSSPPLENHLEPPGETQHHSLKRRARRQARGAHGHGLLGGGEGGGGCGAPPSTEFRVELRKGPGCGALGFTVVGGADSPRGALPIFVRSVLEGGQAAHDGRLQPGDELLLLNGQPLRGSTHAEAVAMFRAVRAGPVVLTVCRRTTKKAQSCSDLVVGAQSTQREGDS